MFSFQVLTLPKKVIVYLIKGRKGIFSVLASEMLSIYLAFWILTELKVDFCFPVHINMLLKIQSLALKKEQKHVFYIEFNTIPSYN